MANERVGAELGNRPNNECVCEVRRFNCRLIHDFTGSYNTLLTFALISVILGMMIHFLVVPSSQQEQEATSEVRRRGSLNRAGPGAATWRGTRMEHTDLVCAEPPPR